MRLLATFTSLFAVSFIGVAFATDPPKRAKPPAWSKDVLDVFFPDAREALVGPRPDFAASSETIVANTIPSATPSAATGDGKPGWSQWIEPEVLESEIKRQSTELEKLVKSASEFKGGGYQDARNRFSLLAVLFAISAEHDQDARWKDSAAGLRDLFGRAGFNAKVGTDGTFREAVARSTDLAELIRGGRPTTPTPNADAGWTTISDRPPLMNRMEQAQQERLAQWIANEALFGGHTEEISHEAQLLAALAEVITREGYEYSDDDTFVEYAKELREAAREVQQATELEDYAQARAALGRATKACSTCHDGYRG
jgi:hypothetical protein